MHDNNKFDELLISYLANELNEEDEAFVLDWINFSEEHRLHFQQLSEAWKLLNAKLGSDGIDVNNEWKRFEKSVNTRQLKASLLNHVEQIASEAMTSDEDAQNESRKPSIYRVAVTTVLAASVAVTLFLVADYFSANHDVQKRLAKVIAKKPPRDTATAAHIVNTSGTEERVMLKDGTEILLADNSEISYPLPFGDKRNVVLKGKAYFKVAKDKSRPFTVFTNNLRTTVLGTRFTVTAFENDQHISVRLYEGKVVVKGVLVMRKKRMSDCYLHPGQELVYNDRTYVARLTSFRDNTPSIAQVKHEHRVTENPDLPTIPYFEKESWYMFNNQSLGQVFDELKKLHQVEIVYSKREVAGKYFIGKFEKSDSIESVLKQITAVNNLKLKKKSDRFIISK